MLQKRTVPTGLKSVRYLCLNIEMRSLRISDSIKAGSSLREARSDTAAGSGKKEKSKFFKAVKNIGMGHTWSDTSGFSFTYRWLD